MRAAITIPAIQRTETQNAALLEYFKNSDSDWKKLSAAMTDHGRKVPQPALTKVLICREGVPAVRLHTQGPDFYDKTFILKRGDLNQKQAEAPTGFLQVVTRGEEQRWLAAPPAGRRRRCAGRPSRAGSPIPKRAPGIC